MAESRMETEAPSIQASGICLYDPLPAGTQGDRVLAQRSPRRTWVGGLL